MRRLTHIGALGIAALMAALALSCGSGGGSGPTGPNPPSDPTILYCRVVELSNVIHLQWATDRPTRGEVRYGRTSYTNLLNVTAREDTHDVALSGLEYNVSYIYRLTVYDSLEHHAETTGDFATPAKATPEPIISGFEIVNVTESSATLHWLTDEPATTILYYGLSALTDSMVDDVLTLDHQVELAGLAPSTSYRLRAEAVDSTDLRGYGPDTTMATAPLMRMWFPDTTLGVGDTVRVPIYVEDVQDLAALRIAMTFLPGSVEVVAMDEGPFYAERNGFIFFSDIRNPSGKVFADLTWTIEYNGNVRIGTDADGGGIALYARLRGLETGEVYAAFDADSSFGLDMYAAARACSLRAGTITVGP